MNDTLHPVLRIQFYAKEKSFGPGIAKLLQRVEDRHSLRAAAMSMDMAYSKAWTMVRSCEAALDMKLLNYSTGGKNGGGALGRDLREHPREGIGKRHRKKYEQRGGCGRQGGGVLSHASSDGRKNRSSAF